jgi:hypothetical protein
MERSASRPASFGANSSTRIPSALTWARTITGPRLSGVTLMVIVCSPFPAVARAKMGRAICSLKGGGAGAATATGAAAEEVASGAVEPTGDAGVACSWAVWAVMSRTDSVALSLTPDAAAEVDATSETAGDWLALIGSALAVLFGCGVTIPVATTPAACAAVSAVGTALATGFALAEDTAAVVEAVGVAARAVLAWARAGPADNGRGEEPLGASWTGPAESALSGRPVSRFAPDSLTAATMVDAAVAVAVAGAVDAGSLALAAVLAAEFAVVVASAAASGAWLAVRLSRLVGATLDVVAGESDVTAESDVAAASGVAAAVATLVC